MIDYSPLWKTMEEKKVSQYTLLKKGVDNKTLNRLKHNENITALTIEKLCIILECTPNDVLTKLLYVVEVFFILVIFILWFENEVLKINYRILVFDDIFCGYLKKCML